eukprot:sb/3463178/
MYLRSYYHLFITNRTEMDSTGDEEEDELKDAIRADEISDFYTVAWDFELGKGHSGIVRQCVNKETGEECALKCLPDNPASRLEIRLQMRVSTCPNVVKIYDVFKNTLQLPNECEPRDMLLVVLEMMPGGELFERISKRRRFTEREAALVTKQIAVALQHCHANNIAHRDVKPENLLLKSGSSLIVKLADFGFAKLDHGNLTTPKCTPYYVSPQILEASKFRKAAREGTTPEGHTYTYDKSCDMWSLGVILYIMLCGYPPFYSECPSNQLPKSMQLKILKGDYGFPPREWSRVGQQAKTTVVGLLSVDTDLRTTANELLSSSWLSDVDIINSSVDLHDTGIIRNQEQLCAFKAGHAAALQDLSVPEKIEPVVRQSLPSTPSTLIPAIGRLSLTPAVGSSCPTRYSPTTTPTTEGHYVKLLRDIVGHLLMPQKQNYVEGRTSLVHRAVSGQPEGSSLPRILAEEGWDGEQLLLFYFFSLCFGSSATRFTNTNCICQHTMCSAYKFDIIAPTQYTNYCFQCVFSVLLMVLLSLSYISRHIFSSMKETNRVCGGGFCSAKQGVLLSESLLSFVYSSLLQLCSPSSQRTARGIQPTQNSSRGGLGWGT